MSVDMGKKKTSINIDEQLWTDWAIYCIQTTGASRNTSSKAEDALKEYMKNHPAKSTD